MLSSPLYRQGAGATSGPRGLWAYEIRETVESGRKVISGKHW